MLHIRYGDRAQNTFHHNIDSLVFILKNMALAHRHLSTIPTLPSTHTLSVSSPCMHADRNIRSCALPYKIPAANQKTDCPRVRSGYQHKCL